MKADYLINITGSLTILILCLFAVWLRVRRGLLLTGVSGLFMSAALFLGVGPISYFTTEIVWETMTVSFISKYLAEVMPFLISGFLIVSLNEFTKRNKEAPVVVIPVLEEQRAYVKVIVLFFLLSLVGYFLTQTTLAHSGVGTFFPVFRLFLYPSLIMSVYFARISKPVTVLIMLMVLTAGFMLTITSVWRSQLILFFGSVAIGLLLRSRKFQIPFVAGVAIVVLFLLPFQHLKKTEYSKVRSNLLGTFSKTLKLTFEQRLTFTALFFAERINYSREIAFVNHAMAHEWLKYRNGLTYFEMGLQLIPRNLWPGKPSYNFYNNHYIPRRIGLVGEEDEYTSWGVNAYAEFIMNFHYRYLVIFIPLLFWVISLLDNFIVKWFRNPLTRWIASSSLFFITFEMVGVVNVSTYIMWMIIVAKLAEIVFRIKYKRKLSTQQTAGR